jgi:hypothetical protein
MLEVTARNGVVFISPVNERRPPDKIAMWRADECNAVLYVHRDGLAEWDRCGPNRPDFAAVHAISPWLIRRMRTLVWPK